jgi:glycosyltransferase involved in cell wall biosynthesis
MARQGRRPGGAAVTPASLTADNAPVTALARVSVCMATYNGSRFVAAQLRSILDQLGEDDEVIVVDDASTDDTRDAVQALGDHRVQLHVHPINRGYAAAFESALQRATGAHVVLSDQDDVWPTGRLAAMQLALEDASVVVGNVRVLGSDAALSGPWGQASWRLPDDPTRRWRMLAGLAMSNVPYFGSAMALRAEFLPVVLPYPASARELPDAWIAMNALLRGSIAHLDEDVVLRRVHGGNASGTMRSPRAVLRGRLLFLGMLREAVRRRRSGSTVGR